MTAAHREYPTFAAFMEAIVLPGAEANPAHKRLDGAISGGNRDVAGRFWRDGIRWKVHADSHYEPLLMAYGYEQEGGEPFAYAKTKRGRSLVLIDRLQARRKSGHGHLYIYES